MRRDAERRGEFFVGFMVGLAPLREKLFDVIVYNSRNAFF